MTIYAVTCEACGAVVCNMDDDDGSPRVLRESLAERLLAEHECRDVKRWMVVRDEGNYRVILARCWTAWGARRYAKGTLQWQSVMNQWQRDATVPGTTPLPSPFPRPWALTVERAI